ncbi:hypothetical protein [Nevskia sp.]|uniref:hypothetical protein n=1 Tax=Nevskia sp. TaxID=1929292 RepID=UPI0025FFFCB4|nr:hypothetical protein [Nevskia sp.]
MHKVAADCRERCARISARGVFGLLAFAAVSSATGIEKERSAPPVVPGFLLAGVKYEAVRWGASIGATGNGGYLRAVDEITGELLWVHRIYGVMRDVDIEGDKQDVFIVGIHASEGGENLIIETERKHLFHFDLRTHTVEKIR